MCIICNYECKKCLKPDWERLQNAKGLQTFYCASCWQIYEHYINCRKCIWEREIHPCKELKKLKEGI